MTLDDGSRHGECGQNVGKLLLREADGHRVPHRRDLIGKLAVSVRERLRVLPRCHQSTTGLLLVIHRIPRERVDAVPRDLDSAGPVQGLAVSRISVDLESVARDRSGLETIRRVRIRLLPLPREVHRLRRLLRCR